jgi:hypothetical protein
MAKAIASPAALAEWLTMLERIERSVAAALAEMQRRAQAETAPTPPELARTPDGDFRSRLDATMHGLEERLRTVRDFAARVEAILDSDEQVVRAWRQTAESARARLAATAGL